eukprot:3019347-Pleurochrysis_carterae.AAC.1
MCNTHVEKKAKTDSEAPVVEAKKVEETTTAAEADAGTIASSCMSPTLADNTFWWHLLPHWRV